MPTGNTDWDNASNGSGPQPAPFVIPISVESLVGANSAGEVALRRFMSMVDETYLKQRRLPVSLLKGMSGEAPAVNEVTQSLRDHAMSSLTPTIVREGFLLSHLFNARYCRVLQALHPEALGADDADEDAPIDAKATSTSASSASAGSGAPSSHHGHGRQETCDASGRWLEDIQLCATLSAEEGAKRQKRNDDASSEQQQQKSASAAADGAKDAADVVRRYIRFGPHSWVRIVPAGLNLAAKGHHVMLRRHVMRFCIFDHCQRVAGTNVAVPAPCAWLAQLQAYEIAMLEILSSQRLADRRLPETHLRLLLWCLQTSAGEAEAAQKENDNTASESGGNGGGFGGGSFNQQQESNSGGFGGGSFNQERGAMGLAISMGIVSTVPKMAGKRYVAPQSRPTTDSAIAAANTSGSAAALAMDADAFPERDIVFPPRGFFAPALPIATSRFSQNPDGTNVDSRGVAPLSKLAPSFRESVQTGALAIISFCYRSTDLLLFGSRCTVGETPLSEVVAQMRQRSAATAPPSSLFHPTHPLQPSAVAENDAADADAAGARRKKTNNGVLPVSSGRLAQWSAASEEGSFRAGPLAHYSGEGATFDCAVMAFAAALSHTLEHSLGASPVDTTLIRRNYFRTVVRELRESAEEYAIARGWAPKPAAAPTTATTTAPFSGGLEPLRPLSPPAAGGGGGYSYVAPPVAAALPFAAQPSLSPFVVNPPPTVDELEMQFESFIALFEACVTSEAVRRDPLPQPLVEYFERICSFAR